MLRAGVTFYALEKDVSRRGMDAAAKHIIATTYDEFLGQLLKQSGGGDQHLDPLYLVEHFITLKYTMIPVK